MDSDSKTPLLVRGILFDKDGTLIDFNRTWLPVYQRASQYLADHFGQPELADDLLLQGGYEPESNTWQANSLLAAGSNKQILEAWQAAVGSAFNNAVKSTLYTIFSAEHLQPVAVMTELRTMLLKLRGDGLVLGVATMDDEAQARQTLQTLNVLDCFDFICGADSGFGIKPEPGMVAHFAEANCIRATSVVVVGDSPHDLVMSANAGATAAIGVLTGASSHATLAAHTQHILPSIEALPEWLDQHTATTLDRPRHNPWKTLARTQVYDNPWINVSHERVINPSGGTGIYGKVGFKNRAVGIVPLDAELNTWLVGQYRYPIDCYSWEIPEGGGPPGTSLLASAQRELKEETGLRAACWTQVLETHASNSVTDEYGVIFVAQGLQQGESAPEETEDLTIRKLPFSTAVQMVMNGEITDALAMLAIMKVNWLLEQRDPRLLG